MLSNQSVFERWVANNKMLITCICGGFSGVLFRQILDNRQSDIVFTIVWLAIAAIVGKTFDLFFANT